MENKCIYFIIKRLFDILISIIGIIFLIPISLLIKIVYLLTGDFNCIFYYQERIGKNGKKFKLLKYRTMDINADEKLEELLKDKNIKKEWEMYHKLSNDPRMTKIGKFLRKSSIDEMPQFINILKGEMSFIGPRPLRNNELDIKECKKIFVVKPGLTGYWQVNGRSNITFKDRINLEKYYAKNCNLKLDFVIILKTIKLIIYDRNAK